MKFTKIYQDSDFNNSLVLSGQPLVFLGYQNGVSGTIDEIALRVKDTSGTFNNLVKSDRISTINTIKVNNIEQQVVEKTVNLQVIQNPSGATVGQFLQRTATGWAGADGLVTVNNTVSSVTNNMIITSNKTLPVTLKTNKGNLYPIEKNTLTEDASYFYIDIEPYLVYDNSAAFTAPWEVYYGAGINRRNVNTVYNGQPASGYYSADYDLGDIHVISSNTADLQILTPNIPLGEGILIRIINVNDSDITVGTKIVVAEAGQYSISVINLTGTPEVLGDPIKLK